MSGFAFYIDSIPTFYTSESLDIYTYELALIVTLMQGAVKHGRGRKTREGKRKTRGGKRKTQKGKLKTRGVGENAHINGRAMCDA